MDGENLEVPRRIAPHKGDAVTLWRPQRKNCPRYRQFCDLRSAKVMMRRPCPLRPQGAKDDALAVGREGGKGVVVGARCQHLNAPAIVIEHHHLAAAVDGINRLLVAPGKNP